MLRKRIEIAVMAIMVIAVISYAGVGFARAGDRIAGAERSLNAVGSHQNTLNSTFDGINIQLTASEIGNHDIDRIGSGSTCSSST